MTILLKIPKQPFLIILVFEVTKMKHISIENYLKKANYKKSIGNFCFNYYELFIEDKSEELAIENFVKLLEWKRDSDESLEISEKLSEEVYQEKVSNLYPIVQKIVDNLIKENFEENEFYATLYKKITDDILFPAKEEKISAIIILMLERRIPYFHLDEATRMDNDVYKAISDSIYKQICKAYFILEYGYEQRTEVASQLYRLVTEQETYEDRLVLISNILGYLNAKIKFLYEKLHKDSE